MASIADADVKKAAAELGAMGGNAEPVLRPEQVERITAIAKEGDPEAKAEKTMAMMQELLQEAATASAKLEAMYAQLGLTAEQANRFLSGDRLSAGAKEIVGAATAGFVEETMAEVEREAKRASAPAKAKAPRPDRLRV